MWKVIFVKKRSIWMFSMLSLSLVGMVSTAISLEGAPCGTVLASYKGISAQSNKNYSWGSCGGRSVYGLQYQCVEYVRRFYHLVKGIETREGITEKQWEGDGNTYFKTAAEKGLDAFKNGGSDPPLPDDILTFQGGLWGHVAIITAVSDDHIEFIEQNISPTGTDRLAYNPITHRVANRNLRGGKLISEGWLRPHSGGPVHASAMDMNTLP
jgi:hypothetical protein